MTAKAVNSEKKGSVMDLDEVLADLAAQDVDLSNADLGRLFRSIYDHWVLRGGHRRGKPRHSVRKIKLWLGDANEVRSLETKLAGKTLLQRQDAINLLRLFLKRWTYDAEREVYRAYRDAYADELANRLAASLFPAGRSTLHLPLRSRSNKSLSGRADEESSAGLSPSRDVLKDLFLSSGALITISSAQTLIGPNPASMMRGFRSLMRDLHDIDAQDETDRALIWIVDLGLRNDTENSIAAYLNVVWLATQFRSMAVIDPMNGIDLWRWLDRRAIVLVGSLEQHEIDQCYAAAELSIAPADGSPRWLRGSDILIEAEPTEWKRKDKALQAFGEALEVWRRRTITAHLSLGPWQEGDLADVDPARDLRFFFHGAMAGGDQGVRCLELGPPGQRWSDSMRLACTAAFWRLGWKRRVGPIKEPERAMALLRYHGLAALTLRDFVRLTNNLIETNLSATRTF